MLKRVVFLTGSLDVKASEIEAEVVEIEQNQAVNNGENVILEREDKSTDEDVVPESEGIASIIVGIIFGL